VHPWFKRKSTRGKKIVIRNNDNDDDDDDDDDDVNNNLMVKVKLLPCLSKTCGGTGRVEVKLHAFCISGFDEGSVISFTLQPL
jgi:hypothetical protein